LVLGNIEIDSGGSVTLTTGSAFVINASTFINSVGQIIYPNESVASSAVLSSENVVSYISSDGQSTTATYLLPVGSSGQMKYVVAGSGDGTTGCVVLRTAATSCSFDGTNNIATFTTAGNVTLVLWCESTNRWVVLSALSSALTSSEPITFSANA